MEANRSECTKFQKYPFISIDIFFMYSLYCKCQYFRMKNKKNIRLTSYRINEFWNVYNITLYSGKSNGFRVFYILWSLLTYLRFSLVILLLLSIVRQQDLSFFLSLTLWSFITNSKNKQPFELNARKLWIKCAFWRINLFKKYIFTRK